MRMRMRMRSSALTKRCRANELSNSQAERVVIQRRESGEHIGTTIPERQEGDSRGGLAQTEV